MVLTIIMNDENDENDDDDLYIYNYNYEVYRRLARHSPRAEANIVKACNTMQYILYLY